MVNMSTFFQYPNEEPAEEEPRFLGDFSEKDLQKVYSIGEVQQFAAGEIAVTEGATDTSLFIVLEGRAEVLIPKRRGWYKVASLGPRQCLWRAVLLRQAAPLGPGCCPHRHQRSQDQRLLLPASSGARHRPGPGLRAGPGQNPEPPPAPHEPARPDISQVARPRWRSGRLNSPNVLCYLCGPLPSVNRVKSTSSHLPQPSWYHTDTTIEVSTLPIFTKALL